MYRLSLVDAGPDDVLARTVFDGRTGQALLTAGSPLTPTYRDALARRGVLTVYVRDGLADDVLPVDLVSEQVRTTLTGHVATAFDRVALVAAERAVPGSPVDAAVDALGEQPLELGADGHALVADLYGDIERLIAEIVQGDTLTGLESLKSHNAYTFEHSVDVAVIGVLLGRSLGMPHDRLRELALGCLLHDIGKTYIDVAILDKPGPLTPNEWDAVKQHPLMGFEVIRRMPVDSLLAAHVAYQHHERQNGLGYPRGLVGAGRVGPRLTAEAIGAGRMLLIAEIAAVADVYSALSSDRPYRPGMSPDRTIALLRSMADGHLNRELVARLETLVPSYPVGWWVELEGGPHAGWRGVCSDLHPGQLDRPTVRLLLDERGEALASPFELDTRTVPEVALHCLPPRADPHAHREPLTPAVGAPRAPAG